MNLRSALSHNPLLHYVFDRWKGAAVSLHKTLFFNLSALPLRQALTFPVYVYQGVKLEQVGRIEFACPLQRGMVRIGKRMFFRGAQTTFINRGTVTFGGRCLIMGGGTVHVLRNCSRLRLDDNVMLGENVAVLCDTAISVGAATRITFGCVLIDSEFHYVLNTTTGEVAQRTKPITIGRYNWIGNRSTIKKGVKTPDFCIVSNGSMLTKDFSQEPPYTLLIGTPAKVKGTGFRRVYKDESDGWLNQQFADGTCAKVRVPATPGDGDYNAFCEGDIDVTVH